jgi:serine/threonine-protein kinase
LARAEWSEVYLVQHPRLPRHDALKVLRPDVSSDTSFREGFIREADLAAGLRHPHIVGIHDRGELEGQLWIAMDYIDGCDAAHLIEQRYPAGMPVELANPFIAAVASSLGCAHKRVCCTETSSPRTSSSLISTAMIGRFSWPTSVSPDR